MSTNSEEKSLDELRTEIEATISQHGIRHLISHGSSGEYWHPAHRCLHKHARKITRANQKLWLYTFNAWQKTHPLPGIINHDDPADFTADFSQHHEQRLAALAAHQSQAAVFERFGEGSLDKFIKLSARENYRQW
jgi:LmbE family N-acetylglucosaminyl deacetylase